MNKKQNTGPDHFRCEQCGTCCRQKGFVYLKPGEVEALAEYLGEDVYRAVESYCELLERRCLVLKKKNGEECIFLEKNRCRIYPVRPSQCRTFPLLWKTERSLWYCPGQRPEHKK